MLKTKSIYAPSDPNDGERVLVTRFYPRGVKRERFHEWRRELAPSVRLLKQYKEMEISEDEFERCFKIEMNAVASRQAIKDLRTRAMVSNVTLLCYEPEGEMCHRNILQEIIRNMLHASLKSKYADYHE